MTQPPPPYQYPPGAVPPPLPQSAKNPGLQFVIGLVIGVAASVLVWWVFFSLVGANATELLIGVMLLVALKMGFGIFYSTRPLQRMIGAGLLTSLGVGFLIFTGGLLSGVSDAFGGPKPVASNTNGAPS